MPRYRLQCCEPRLEGLPVGRISSGDAAGRYIAVVSREKGYAFLHDATGGLLVRHDIDFFQAVRVAPNGFHIAFSLRSGRLYAFHAEDRVPLWEKSLRDMGRVTAIDMAKRSGTVAVGSEKGLALVSGEGVLYYRSKLCRGLICKPRMVTGLAWSSGGRRLAVATRDSKLLVLSSEGEVLAETELPAPAVKMAWNESGEAIVAGLATGEVVVVGVTREALVVAAGRGLGERIEAVTVSPLGDILVAWRSGSETIISSFPLDMRRTLWSESIGEYRVKRIAVLEEHSIIVITDYSEAVFSLEPVLKREEEAEPSGRSGENIPEKLLEHASRVKAVVAKHIRLAQERLTGFQDIGV